MPPRDLAGSSPLIISLLCFYSLLSLAVSHGGTCELSVVHRNTLYNFSLASPSSKFPHGALSEDGFYKVAVNETVLWFQLCDLMIFNHDQPMCLNCEECGGPSRCGMTCSALVSNNLGGYDVCTTVGKASNSQVSLIDMDNPQKGVIVKMVSLGTKSNCSLSVSVLCDSTLVKVPDSFNVSGECDYVTQLTHPSGCALSVAVSGKGWGWFATLLFIMLCLLGVYILVGTVYRFFFLGIHSLEAIPNLEFWMSLPQRTRIFFGSLVRKFRGQSRGSQASYAPMNYQ